MRGFKTGPPGFFISTGVDGATVRAQMDGAAPALNSLRVLLQALSSSIK